jgi:pyruvate,water dikinase
LNSGAGHYFENWDELYQAWEVKLRPLIKEIDGINVTPLANFDDERAVLEGRGIAQDHFVRERYQRCIDLFSIMWHHHFELLMLGYGGYLVYFQFCKQAFPEIAEQTVAQIVSGIAIKMVPGRVGLGPCRSKHSNMPAMTLPEPLPLARSGAWEQVFSSVEP